jgi:hypothetical protein
MGRHGGARLAAIAVAVVCVGWVPAAQPAPSEVDALIARVGARVADYYRRAQRVICVERSIVQPIQTDWSPDGFARIVESELRMESDAADDGDALPGVALVRDIRRINGRAPQERDRTARSGCTDPNPLSPEPIAFLLPSHRDQYRFISVRDGREQDRAALIVEFASRNQRSRPELIEDERGHDDCFDWTGPVAAKGRVWVDASTHDVLRVERHIPGPVDVKVPWRLQRQYNLPPWIVIDRDDQTIRFRATAFRDPDEVLLLPASIESMTVLRSGLQSVRRTDTFTDYRRFLTAGRVKDR